jgi:hypothetical protein
MSKKNKGHYSLTEYDDYSGALGIHSHEIQTQHLDARASIMRGVYTIPDSLVCDPFNESVLFLGKSASNKHVGIKDEGHVIWHASINEANTASVNTTEMVKIVMLNIVYCEG